MPLADVYTILDPMARIPALSALLPYLPDQPRYGRPRCDRNGGKRFPAYIKASIWRRLRP
jgi:hypothetical protein